METITDPVLQELLREIYGEREKEELADSEARHNAFLQEK
jgi:hypothetical protein